MPIPLDDVLEATRAITRYDVQIEHKPGIRIHGRIDSRARRQHLQIGLSEGSFPLGEVYWSEGRGYGRPISSDRWLELSDKPLPHYPEVLANLLQQGRTVHEREQSDHWLIELEFDSLSLLDDPEAFRRALFGDPRNERERRFIEDFETTVRQLSLRIELTVAKPGGPIRGCAIHSRTARVASTMSIDLEPQSAGPGDLPEDLPRLMISGITVPSSLLLLELPDLAGWVPEETHATWAERAIRLIRDVEASLPAHERRYDEIYRWPAGSVTPYASFTEAVARQGGLGLDPQQHHPIVLGAYYEDNTDPLPQFYDQWFQSDPDYQNDQSFYWNPSGYFRDYHHFGGSDIGLRDEWYFVFRGSPPTTRPGDRFYSARDWGYGAGRINESLNRLTFTAAIRQYNRATLEGKRNAYLMIGHVVHLLQDLGQPDHAKLVAHAASGKTMESAYNEYHYCEFLAGYAATQACGACFLFCPPCAAVAFAAAYGACQASIDSAIMGYERLVGNLWSLSMADAAISQGNIVRHPDYDAYFEAMAQHSAEAADARGLTSPLGCADLLAFFPGPPVPIPVPGAMPTIDSERASERAPFLDLTTEIVPSIVGLSAGLICHFFEIVNQPPIVERVRVVQWEDRATPLGFGVFANSANHCVRYDSAWQNRPMPPAPGGPRQRELHQLRPPQPLSHDRPAYIFVLFGPTTPPGQGRRMKAVELRLQGTNLLNGEPIDEPVQMNMSHDPAVGYFYWGSFSPRNCAPDPNTLTMRIAGRDNEAHLATRVPLGDELDADPSTIAIVNPAFDGGLTYDWTYYHPGPDRHHKIQVAAFEGWRLVVIPANSTIALDTVGQEERVSLRIEQTAWDCQWEPFWGPLACTARWHLQPQVRRLDTPPQFESWTFFGFEVRMAPRQAPGMAELVVSLPTNNYRRSRYEITLDYEIGEAPYVNNGTQIVAVELS